ncbi:hypothetical protein QBC39DRAFT_328574 [Podospora conica]|nr:hypothetical protein QBC39DRAFT_328574 [Schizothecium conicum]
MSSDTPTKSGTTLPKPRMPHPKSLTINDHPDPQAAFLAWSHIYRTHPFSPDTDKVEEYVASMLDSLANDSLDAKARRADVLALTRRMCKSLLRVEQEMFGDMYGDISWVHAAAPDENIRELGAFSERMEKTGDARVKPMASWMYFYVRIVKVLEREILSLLVSAIGGGASLTGLELPAEARKVKIEAQQLDASGEMERLLKIVRRAMVAPEPVLEIEIEEREWESSSGPERLGWHRCWRQRGLSSLASPHTDHTYALVSAAVDTRNDAASKVLSSFIEAQPKITASTIGPIFQINMFAKLVAILTPARGGRNRNAHKTPVSNPFSASPAFARDVIC